MEVTPGGMAVVTFTLLDALFTRLIDKGLLDQADQVAIFNEARVSLTSSQDAAAFDQAMRARYDEFDVVANVRLEAAAAARALDRVGPSVLVTSSAGGLRALLTATQSANVKAIVAYENPGYLFPEGEAADQADTPFGPLHVPRADFLKLTRVPMQFVWGDNLDKSPLWQSRLEQCRAFVALINASGGQAEIVVLPEKGLHGNTHMPFVDMNNEVVAELLAQFLAANHLD